MIVGYARTSTIEQEAGFEHQLKKLKENKCEKIFKEQVSAYANRNELKMFRVCKNWRYFNSYSIIKVC